MSLWRIATEARTYRAVDATGTGAKITGGRWNHPGVSIVYSAPSIALAVLEAVVHLDAAALPLNRYLIRIDVPDEVWSRRSLIDRETAPAGWDAEPAGIASLEYGDAWVKSRSSVLLMVPSVVVPMELNALVNPEHPDAVSLTFSNTGRFVFDQRIRSA